jgi:hypothetical protein
MDINNSIVYENFKKWTNPKNITPKCIEDSLDNILGTRNLSDNNNLYIKMDIEGWEMNALKGAENLIKTLKPKLAICVYHKPNDFLEIYNYIKELNPNYKIYLRHYTEGVVETVMYFIP